MPLENSKLPFNEAVGYVRNWLDRKMIVTTDLRAFTIRRSELEFLLLQMSINQCNAARFYLGDKADSMEDPIKPCLIMVGVDCFVPAIDLKNSYLSKGPAAPFLESIPGTEQYFYDFQAGIPVQPANAPTNKAGNIEYVLDFAYPCPDTCALESELMTPPTP